MLSPANTPLAPGCDRARKPSDTRPGHDPPARDLSGPRPESLTDGHRTQPTIAVTSGVALAAQRSTVTHPARHPPPGHARLDIRSRQGRRRLNPHSAKDSEALRPWLIRINAGNASLQANGTANADAELTVDGVDSRSDGVRQLDQHARPNQLRAAGRPQLRSDHVLLRQQHGAVATGSVTISTPHRSAPTRAAASLAPRPPANPVKAPAAAVHGRGRFGRTRGAMSRLSRASDPFSSRSGVAHHLNAGETLVVVASGQPPRLAMLLTVHVRDTIPFAARLMVYVSPVATAVAVSVKLLAVPVALLM